jgi:hypothetical protein
MLLAQTLDRSILWHDMTDLQVSNVPADCDLLATNHLVCHPRIAPINANICQTLGELLTAWQTCNHAFMESILALDQQLGCSFLVLRDARFACVWGNIDEHVCKDASNLDKDHVLLIFNARLCKPIECLDSGNVPSFLCINNAGEQS